MNVHRPRVGDDPEFASVFQLRDFAAGDLRRRALDGVVGLVQADAVCDTHTGPEPWFAPSPRPVARWAMGAAAGSIDGRCLDVVRRCRARAARSVRRPVHRSALLDA